MFTVKMVTQQEIAPPLKPHEVHVYKAWLNTSPEPYEHLLSQDERLRAARYLDKKDGAAFTVCRGILRTLLSRYTTQELIFSYSHYGKPALDPHTLSFNVSHSHDLALFAFSYKAEVGIDLEKVRPLKSLQSLITRYLTDKEKQEIHSLPAAAQLEAFFHFWTRKEACLKALGIGLAGALDALDDEQWFLQPLTPEPGYLAAVALQRTMIC